MSSPIGWVGFQQAYRGSANRSSCKGSDLEGGQWPAHAQGHPPRLLTPREGASSLLVWPENRLTYSPPPASSLLAFSLWGRQGKRRDNGPGPRATSVFPGSVPSAEGKAALTPLTPGLVRPQPPAGPSSKCLETF